jgi:hypothetical protein
VLRRTVSRPACKLTSGVPVQLRGVMLPVPAVVPAMARRRENCGSGQLHIRVLALLPRRLLIGRTLLRLAAQVFRLGPFASDQSAPDPYPWQCKCIFVDVADGSKSHVCV